MTTHTITIITCSSTRLKQLLTYRAIREKTWDKTLQGRPLNAHHINTKMYNIRNLYNNIEVGPCSINIL